MLKAMLRRYRISQLEREYRSACAYICNIVYGHQRDAELLKQQEIFLEAKGKLFVNGPTIGGLTWMLWYKARYNWWVAKERRFTKWLLKATPYIKVGRAVHCMNPGSPAHVQMQEKVDAFYKKYDWIIASYTEARNRHLGVK